jgi:hypothetical protein
MAAQTIFSKYSRFTPAEGLNRTVLFITRATQKATPFVTTGQIDSELSVITTPQLSTRGARKGLPKRPRRKDGAPPVDVTVVQGGLATMVTLARLHRYSNYNVLTDLKYAIDRLTFSPGEGEAAFWDKIEEVAKRMVKSRHSSTHFFQASWTAVIKKLIPFVPRPYGGMGSGSFRSVPDDLGEVVPARSGEPRVTCVISNKLGMDDRYPTISAIRNMEAHRILEPVLQMAINAEYESKMAEAGRRGWLDYAPSLNTLGIKVAG